MNAQQVEDLLQGQLECVKQQLRCVTQFANSAQLSERHLKLLSEIQTNLQGLVKNTVRNVSTVDASENQKDKRSKFDGVKTDSDLQKYKKDARITLFAGSCKRANGEVHASCAFSMYARVFLLEAGVPFKVELIDLDEERPAWFVEHHPAGTCPAAIMDGDWVTDSRQIVSRAKEMYAKETAGLVQECALDASLHGRMLGALFGYLMCAPSEEDAEKTKGALAAVLSEVDAHLSGRELMCGDTFSESDALWSPFLVLTSVLLNEFKGVDLQAWYPCLGRYVGVVARRAHLRRCLGPAFKEVAVKTFDEHPKFKGKITRRTRITLFAGSCKRANGEVHASCAFSMYARVFLLEAGVPFKVELIDLDEERPAWFVEHHPAGTCPAAIMDGDWVTDSRQIVSRAKEMYAKETAGLVQECALDASLHGRMLGALFGYLMCAPSEEDAEKTKGALAAVLSEVDAHLSGRELMCGDTFSESDALWSPFLVLTSVLLNEFKGVDLQAWYPSLGRYVGVVVRRAHLRRCLGPAFKEVAVKTFDEHPKFKGKITREGFAQQRVKTSLARIEVSVPPSPVAAILSSRLPMPRNKSDRKRAGGDASTFSSANSGVNESQITVDTQRTGVSVPTPAKLRWMSTVHAISAVRRLEKDAKVHPAPLSPSRLKQSKSAVANSRQIEWRSILSNGNWYFLLIDTSYPHFALLVLLMYVVCIVVSAIVLLPIHEQLAGGERESSFGMCLWAAGTNIVTAGSGYITPKSSLAFFLMTLQQFIGIILNVSLFSVAVTKFQRPRADIVFSKTAILNFRQGVPHLLFRIGNRRCNLIYNPQIQVSLMQRAATTEGESFVKQYPLALVQEISAFSGTVTAAHAVTRSSPLYEIVAALHRRHERGDGESDWDDDKWDLLHDFMISVVITGLDDTYHSEISAIKKFKPRHLVWASRFEDMFRARSDAAGSGAAPQLDFEKFDNFLPIDGRFPPLPVLEPQAGVEALTFEHDPKDGLRAHTNPISRAPPGPSIRTIKVRNKSHADRKGSVEFCL